ncbi:MAG TPA: sugar kinase [Aggregatilineales bacterium]|nr:sugar kinase [Aggregatilineales bacterium]
MNVTETLPDIVGFDVIVVGDLNPDLILTGNVEATFGQVEKFVDDAMLTIGGSAAICACGAARLGLRTALIGKVGGDTFGRIMLQQLAERDVDTSGMIVDAGAKTGLSVHLARADDRAMLTYSGAIGALRYEEINLGMLTQARHLHLGSYFLLESLRPKIGDLFRLAHRLNLTNSLDTNYDPSGRWDDGLSDVLPCTDVVFLNQTELAAISHESDLDTALDCLIQTVPLVVVKMGKHGAIARSRTERIHNASLEVPVVDTTGAGDSFDAGFLYGHIKNWNIARSLQLACICGSLSTRAIGGTTAQTSLEDAGPFLEHIN